MVAVLVHGRVWEASAAIIEPGLKKQFDIALSTVCCVLLKWCNIVVILPFIAHCNVSVPPQNGTGTCEAHQAQVNK